MRWQYGVTTVPERFETYLPRTLDSLAKAGFDGPCLFVDGCDMVPSYLDSYASTLRPERVGCYGNWWLAAVELFLRSPRADRYAIFQDDFLCCSDFRERLNAPDLPDHCNLSLTPENLDDSKYGWYLSNQKGRGAVALVFSNRCFESLLQSPLPRRPKLYKGERGTKAIDGAIADCLKTSYPEYVHNPPLIRHIGDETTLAHGHHPQVEAPEESLL